MHDTLEPQAGMNRSIRLLHLEDDPRDAEVIRLKLQAEHLFCDITWVRDKEAFESALGRDGFDLVLSDYNLPDYDGMSALRRVQEKQPELPVILISGTLGEEAAVDCLKAGAADYVLKQRLQRLGIAVRRAFAEKMERMKRVAAENAIRESEQRFRSLTMATTQIIWTARPNGEAIMNSTEWDDFTGLSRAEAAGWGWNKAVHPDDLERSLRSWRDALESETLFEAEYRLRRHDGEYRDMAVRGVPVRAADGSIREWVGTCTDITERKQTEEQIRRLSRIRELLSGINALIVRTRDPKQLFEEACRLAVEQGGFAFAWIGSPVLGASKVRPMAWTGMDDGYLSEIGQALTKVTDDPGATGRALREKRVIIANDIEHDQEVVFKKAALARGFRSLAAFPLVVGEVPAGVLMLYARAAGYFDAEEVKLLTELAGDLSFALELIEKEARLDYLAYYDALTELPNRALFLDRCNQALRAAQDEEKPLALIFLDLERFRHINETLGRNAGDALLKDFARRLKTTLRGGADIARIGGDNFALLVTGILDASDAARILESEITPAVGAPFEFEGDQYRLSVKAGIALGPADGRDAETLLQNAESSLARAKRAGERWLFYEPQMNARVGERLTLESRLRGALERDEFVLHYQPKADLTSKRISGLEALLRWNDPQAGLVAPLKFITLLEETGMIIEVGRWVMAKAMADSVAWRSEGFDVPRIAVNVSPIQLRQSDFVRSVEDTLSAAGDSVGRLELEITESVIMHDIESNIVKLRALRDMGVAVTIDDFGTGYSSLSYISKLPLNALKIDRAFIVKMTSSPDDLSIVSTIISLAHSLNLRVVAEGVESEAQANLLRLLKCDEIQGYLFSPPLADFLNSAVFLRDCGLSRNAKRDREASGVAKRLY